MKEFRPEKKQPLHHDRAADVAQSARGGLFIRTLPSKAEGRAPLIKLLRRRSYFPVSPNAAPTTAIGAAVTSHDQVEAERTGPQTITRCRYSKALQRKQTASAEQTSDAFPQGSPRPAMVSSTRWMSLASPPSQYSDPDVGTSLGKGPEVTVQGVKSASGEARKNGRTKSFGIPQVLDTEAKVGTRGKKEVRWIILDVRTLVIVVLAAVAVLLSRQSWALRQEKLCKTKDCLAYASLLLHAVNTRIDPCEDPYNHVCSRWLPDSKYRNNPMSTLDEVKYAWYKEFNTALDRGALVLPIGWKVRAMYDSRVTTESQYGESATPFMDFLRQYGLRWLASLESNVTALGVLIALYAVIQAAF
ncbi:hypothetical protein MRX96_034166 [Rhipicephalus microplus]